MKRGELVQDIATARQSLVESLVSMGDLSLNGTRDDADVNDLTTALAQIHSAMNTVELVSKRLQFLQHLEHLRSGSVTTSGRWQTVSLVRLGVDCGYAIDDVHRIVEAALGGVVTQAGTPPEAPPDGHAGAGQTSKPTE